MARHPANTSEKQLSRRVLVKIKRDMTEITPRVIWQHEKPILEELFGEGNITEVDPATLDDGYTAKASPSLLIYNKTQDVVQKPSETQGIGFVFISDPAVEYQRLAEVYGKHKDENVLLVEKIYGRLQSGQFQRLMGSPSLNDLPEAQIRGLILGYGYAPDTHKDATQEEKQATLAMRKALAEMKIDGLVKLAEEVGVEIA